MDWTSENTNKVSHKKILVEISFRRELLSTRTPIVSLVSNLEWVVEVSGKRLPSFSRHKSASFVQVTDPRRFQT
jgi:hypothetical protein